MDYDSTPSWSYITQIMTKNAQYLDAVTFYAHNDMDMMEIGNGNFTVEEERTHFATWALMKSPILLGTDVSCPRSLSVDPSLRLHSLNSSPSYPLTKSPSSPMLR